LHPSAFGGKFHAGVGPEEDMLGGRNDDAVELECPECGAHVKTTAKEAEEGKVRCPNGHEFVVMGMLGSAVRGDPSGTSQ
jgi:hypothetical protein